MKLQGYRAIIFAVVIVTIVFFAHVGFAQVLRTGMRGEEVRALQESLVELGHDLDIDGVFGPLTKDAVLQVQELTAIKTDGIVGKQTQAALRTLTESVTPYIVQSGDTLSGIAFAYGTTINQIMRRNDLTNPNQVRVGQKLLVPSISQAVMGTTRSSTRLTFNWPVQGRISSSYGWRTHPIKRIRHFHGGIDIQANRGTAIRAAASGTVVDAGPMGAYGLGIIIDHGYGYTTWYGHCAKVTVRVGDQVQKGQIIAQVGSTGQSTGPHLDFRIKIGDFTVNPLDYLP